MQVARHTALSNTPESTFCVGRPADRLNMRFLHCGIIVHNFKIAVNINGLRIYLALVFLSLKTGLEWKHGSQINCQNHIESVQKKNTHTHTQEARIHHGNKVNFLLRTSVNSS